MTSQAAALITDFADHCRILGHFKLFSVFHLHDEEPDGFSTAHSREGKNKMAFD